MYKDDYSLTNVVRHLQYFMKQTYGDYTLNLQYKYAKPVQSTEGNKKFQKIIENSHQKVVVMNANRQMKKKPYVHLISKAYPNEFKGFKNNIETLQKILKLKTNCSHKIDLNSDDEKISFESESMKWVYKNRKMLFKPSYQTVKDGKLFRISLYSQLKRTYQPKKKVIEILSQTINKAIQRQNPSHHSEDKAKSQYNLTKEKVEQKFIQQKDTRQNRQIPLRFKSQQTFELNQCCSIVMSQVFQSVNIKLYNKILELVNNSKNSTNEMIGKVMLSELIDDIFEEFQMELCYEVELRFSNEVIKDFEQLDQEQIEEILSRAATVFVNLSKDPKEFIAQEVVQDLKNMNDHK